jgi:hypothetical protein
LGNRTGPTKVIVLENGTFKTLGTLETLSPNSRSSSVLRAPIAVKINLQLKLEAKKEPPVETGGANI